MQKTGKQIRNIGFARRFQERVQRENPELAKKLTEEEYRSLMDLLFKEVSSLLRDGYRVVFEGYVSFFTKPIKRTCTNMSQSDDMKKWDTFKRRLRWKPLKQMKDTAEVDITEAEYLEASKTKEEKTPTSLS